MRTVAQPMIEHQLGVVEHQVVHSVTSTHAVVIEGLLEGLKPQLGHSRGHFPEDRLKRGRVIEHGIARAERAHNEQLKSLEEKASVGHLLGPPPTYRLLPTTYLASHTLAYYLFQLRNRTSPNPNHIARNIARTPFTVALILSYP